jgi:FO synthase subunit 1
MMPHAPCPMPQPMSRTVTYSPAHTLVPTYECFNRCTYCNFRTDPGKSPWMELAHAEKQLQALQGTGIIEILILSGEVHPQSPRRSAWFQRIYELCQLALSLGFLPHTNAGPLSFEEMALLKEVNVSMGLMLEQLTPKLLETVHRHAPSKVPQRRLQQLEWAGQLQIPFTTGLLLGIGETPDDWRETLEAIASIHCRWGHIQEVILQPHSPGSQQICKVSAFSPEKLPEVVALARQILPPAITLQIPPNLVQQPHLLLACLEAGARDLGGIGPRDEVNPDYPHPHYRALAEILQPASWQLVRRLPVYPQYDSLAPVRLRTAVTHWRNRIASAPY